MERGLQIDQFVILDRLGAGGMGVVYRARDRILDREVALKVIHPQRATPEFRQRFLEEARIAATLTHPGIASVYQAGEVEVEAGEPTEIYAAQELIEGETLAAAIDRGPLPVSSAVDFVLQLLEAMADAHARGIIHRDIKPANLMVTPAGRLKILDFGLAKRLTTPAATTQLLADATLARDEGGDATIIGTPGYMAPEQLRGVSTVRSDLFAVGCVLYEMLTAQRLFPAATLVGGVHHAGARPSAALRSLRPEVPSRLASVIEKAVALDAGERFPDAASFAAALREIVPAPGDRPAPSIGWRRAGRGRSLAAAAAILACALLAIGIWRWSQPAIAFAERDWVLIGGVVNETDDAVFDSALEGALETDLRQSRYVNVFDEGRLANALKMMRLPSSTRIDTERGREICKLAGIRVLLMPKILAAGDAYQLEASLIEPGSGRVVDSLRVTARSREEVLLSGIDEFTREVRQRLGESLPSIQKTDPPLVEYATPSWEALRYIKLAGEALGAADIAGGARALEQALEHDPKFPSALASLGILNIEFLNKPDEGRRMLATALANSSSTISEREYFMVRALNRQFVTGEPAGALEDYQYLMTLYPDLFQPHNNSGRILAQLGRYSEAAAEFEKAHALDPRHTAPLWNLWELRLNRLDDPAGAEAHARTLGELQPDNAWIRHLVAWTDVALRRFDRAEQGMREVLSSLPLHPLASANLGHLLLRRGAVDDAVEIYADVLKQARAGVLDMSPSNSALFLGLALAADGRAAEARLVYAAEITGLTTPGRPSSVFDAGQLASLYAAAGERQQAERFARRVMEAQPAAPGVLYVLARTRALLGDQGGAADLLRKARAAGYDQPYFVLIDPALRSLQNHPVIEEIAVPERSRGLR